MNIFNLKYLSVLSIVDYLVIIDYLKYKNINNVVIFDCCNNKDNIFVHKIFKLNNIRTKIINLNKNFNHTNIRTLYRMGVILNTSCLNWEIINNDFFGTTGAESFQYPFIWIYITTNLTTNFNVLSKLPIEVDSDVTVMHKTNKIFHLYDVYNTGTKHNGQYKANKIGEWNFKLNIDLEKRNKIRQDLSGVVLKCTVVIVNKITNETFENYLHRGRQTGLDSLHKMKYFITLMYIGEMFNLTYDLQRTNTWGYFHNGSADGMVGTLQRQETEFGGSPLFFRTDRTWILDYVADLWPSRQSFVFRHPKYATGFYSIYTRPLSLEVWYCISALLIISGGTLCIILKVKFVNCYDCDSSVSSAFLFIWSAICQQGQSLSKDSLAIKIFVFVTFVSSVTLYQYYNATVVSSLLREPPITIKSLKDLVHSNLKAGVEDVTYNKDYFQHTTDPISLQMYRKKIALDNKLNFFSLEQGMDLVKRGGFAFHVDTTTSYTIMKKTFSEREICETRDVIMYPVQKMAAVVRKRSPYKNHLAYGIRKMWETGLMSRLKSVFDESKPVCVQKPDSSIFSVDIREFSSALILLVFGFILSVIILLGEILISVNNNRTTPAKPKFNF